MNRLIFCCFIALIILLSVSCDQNMVFDSFSAIPDNKWPSDSIINFSVDITDTTQNHNLYINIRNSIDYPYSNLWLFISIIPPDGKSFKDTVEFTLADYSGKWLGNGYGKFRDIRYLYKNNTYFPDSGQYFFQLQQGMRNNILEGISDIGIRLEKTN